MLLFPFWYPTGYYTTVSRDPDLDITFDCYGIDRLGNIDQGVIGVTTSILGTWIAKTVISSPIEITLSISGTWLGAVYIKASPIVVTLELTTAGFVFDGITYVPFATGAKSNWFKWSNIGQLDFTIDKGNVSGERPLDWKGNVYAVKKLGNKAVVYGENGVSFVIPSGTTYGLNTIYRIGLKSKNAVAGDESKHFFIDKGGQLWKIGESLEKIDYSEYLSLMSNNLVMSYDAQENLLYICDGSIGYVYNPAIGGFGSCQPNITGLARQGGTLYITSPGTVSQEPFSICTDIYDLGSRKGKFITGLELGINTTKVLSVAIDYRSDIDSSFTQTDWHVVDDNGKVFFPCYGHEFRFRIKASAYEYFTLDYITVKGNVNITGERPQDWGNVYAIKKLGEQVITYGDNGIIALSMADGSRTIHKLGLKGKDAVSGNESVHYFVDTEGHLWSLSDSFKMLDYSEYLSPMGSNLVMSHDVETDLIYICDGTLGYIYSPKSGSLGKGPVNITGVGTQEGILYVVSPATIVTDPFEICTDIYDFGTRKNKTIFSLDFGTDLTVPLYCALDYKRDKAGSFVTTPWSLVSPKGHVNIVAFGIEFRVKVRTLTYSYFEMDWVRINGVTHAS